MPLPSLTQEIFVKKYADCWTRPADVPESVYQDIFEAEIKGDFYTPLAKGKEWLFEHTCRHLPRTGKLLMEGGELFIVCCRWRDYEGEDRYYLELGLEVQGNVVRMGRDPHGKNLGDPARGAFLEERKGWWNPELNFPLPLTEALYTRFDGLCMPGDLLLGIPGGPLPMPTHFWRGWHTYLGYFTGYKKKYFPWLKERIPGVAPEKEKSKSWLKFEAFLYVGWGGGPRNSDALFTKSHIQDGMIYYVRDGDIQNMCLLAAPEEAIDRYCEHILLQKEGRFDFRPYTMPWDVTPSPDLPAVYSHYIYPLPPSLVEEWKNFTIPPPPSAFKKAAEDGTKVPPPQPGSVLEG